MNHPKSLLTNPTTGARKLKRGWTKIDVVFEEGTGGGNHQARDETKGREEKEESSDMTHGVECDLIVRRDVLGRSYAEYIR